MKGLFTDGDDRPLFIFTGTNEEILEWIEANKKQLPLNEWFSCNAELEGDMIRISGDEDYRELTIKEMEPIKVGESSLDRRLERLRNLLNPLWNLAQFVKESGGDPKFKDIIDNTAEKANENMPLITKALDIRTTHQELHQLYSNPENMRIQGKLTKISCSKCGKNHTFEESQLNPIKVGEDPDRTAGTEKCYAIHIMKTCTCGNPMIAKFDMWVYPEKEVNYTETSESACVIVDEPDYENIAKNVND